MCGRLDSLLLHRYYDTIEGGQTRTPVDHIGTVIKEPDGRERGREGGREGGRRREEEGGGRQREGRRDEGGRKGKGGEGGREEGKGREGDNDHSTPSSPQCSHRVG